MPLTLGFRTFLASDAEFVQRLGGEAFSEFSAAAGVSTLRMAQRYPTRLAVAGEVPIGLVIVDVCSAQHGAELLAIGVSTGARGRGVGRRLLAVGEQLALARGVSRISAHTADFNVAALDLFLRHGYRIERRLRRYYRQRVDACELVKVMPMPR